MADKKLFEIGCTCSRWQMAIDLILYSSIFVRGETQYAGWKWIKASKVTFASFAWD